MEPSPGLLELLSSTTKAKNAVADANLESGWRAAAVAALLLVPVTPAVTLFRNEESPAAFGADIPDSRWFSSSHVCRYGLSVVYGCRIPLDPLGIR
ncbi:hypothetical protein [Mobiluncus curtisii]|uniref:Uncharacterized protein n=1 Tax=Mobiluncus curtisii TaxID=2051 RepID=A0A2X3BSE5_9ACTO|nr:hypothetical protein [Mobiluncus curtisii]SQC02276.1 Uncharacterised protein [Mobiluncus curtisii]